MLERTCSYRATCEAAERIDPMADCKPESPSTASSEFGGCLLDMVGVSRSMRRVFEQIRLVAPTRSTVLVTGESGTGKELVVRALHQLSPRKSKPLVALNCAAIPRDLAESELFGHTAGAFTGAQRKRIGKMMAANGGTLFIDEIGEMDRLVQAKLLRALENRTITPVGTNEEHPIDVRVITATHRDLRISTNEGLFREDLYYRLNVIRIDLPPLRDRADDIPHLANHLLQRVNAEHDRRVQEISATAMDSLQVYRWPGNIRELYNVLEAAVILSHSPVIELSDLPVDVQFNLSPSAPTRFRAAYTLAELEIEAIRQCLNQTGGSRNAAAKLLGITARTLTNKMHRHGIARSSQPLGAVGIGLGNIEDIH